MELLAISIPSTFSNVYIAVLRWVMPILIFLILYRSVKPLLFFRREPEIWAWICIQGGESIPVTHWENIIGRHKNSDIVIDFPTVSRTHAVLTRYDDGSWTVSDADSSGGLSVNGRKVKIHALEEEDVIEIGGIEMTLKPISRRQEQKLAKLRTRASSFLDSFLNVVLLSVVQVLCAMAFVMNGKPEMLTQTIVGFGGIMVCQWLLLLFYATIRRSAFEVETIAFLLCTMGMAVIATCVPGEAIKQLISMAGGIVLFLIIGWALRDLERAKKMRYLAAVGGIGLLLLTLAIGQRIGGAKAWIFIGPISLQPSELAKVCFVFVGASAMDRIVTKRNLISFIAYSVIICGCLALMNDFGGALIFFCAFLVIAYLRSGSVGTIGLACTALGFAGVVVVKFAPHALARFATWRHIWEDLSGNGYQQTQGLMRMASGGLLGVGAGNRSENVFPVPDSDMVIPSIGEEWGFLIAVMLVLSIIALGIFVIRSAVVGRSSFYTIGSCAAATVLLMQTILNALGAVDVIPFTGVTFPFLSNGGSGMLCAWGLLAFVKAADTRQNASFAVRLTKSKGGDVDE